MSTHTPNCTTEIRKPRQKRLVDGTKTEKLPLETQISSMRSENCFDELAVVEVSKSVSRQQNVRNQPAAGVDIDLTNNRTTAAPVYAVIRYGHCCSGRDMPIRRPQSLDTER